MNLTSREQEFFAELCSLLRRWLYKYQSRDGTLLEVECESFTHGAMEICLKYEYSPQSLDRFYDLFHRTGANA